METTPHTLPGPVPGGTWGHTEIGGNAQVIQGNVHVSGVNQKEQCWADLRVLDPRDDMDRIERDKDKLLDDAYRWVFSTSEYSHFTTWGNDRALHLPRHRLLWIKGHAGTGKTMLMIGIIRSLSDLASGSGFPDISFFFFQGTSKVLSSAVSALRSLIWLLAIKQPQLFSHVLEQYQYSGARLFTDHNAFSALSKIFQNMLRDPRLSPVYFALDAIDECAEGRLDLIQLILTTFTLSHKVKWLISGRPEVDLSYEFQLLNSDRSNPSETLLELNSQRLGNPVSAYIRYKLEAFTNRRGYTAGILADILREVNLRSENTFLWVSLAFRDLKRVHGGYAVERIRKMPSGLSELYDHMMTRIQTGDLMQPEDCMRVLEAAFLAFRPLSLPELSLLTDLPADMAKEATEKCGSFLTTTGDIVNLIHLSAKEYLERIYSIDLAGKHTAMGRRSLEAMSSRLVFNMYQLSTDSSPSSSSPPDPDPLTPLQYPCEFWADHLCFPSNEALQDNPNLADGGVVWGFLTEHLLQWLESLSLLSKVSKGAQILERLSQAVEAQPIISPRLCRLLSDAVKFLGIHGSIIEKAPLQVYGSALVFSPDSSEVRKMYWESRLPVIRKVVGLRDSWGACIRAFERLGSRVNSIAFSPCGKILAIILKDRSTQVLDIATGACSWSLDGALCWNRVLTTFSPDGELLATVSDGYIELWEVATGTLRQSLYVGLDSTAHTPEVAFSPNGKLLASILGDKTCIWDLAKGSIQPRLLQTLHGVSQIAFSPDSKSLRAFCTWYLPVAHTKIAFWDVETGSIIKIVSTMGHKALRMALWPDGKTLASASSDRYITLWDTMTDDRRSIRLEKGGIFSTVAFSPDGKTLACVSNHSLLLQDTTTGLSLCELPGFPDPTAIAFSPDGKILASAADETTWVWDVATGANRTQPPVRKVIFSSDGKMAASTSDDTNVQLWDVSTGEKRTLRGHRTEVVSCTFSPDGKMLASVSSDRVLYLWDTATGLPRRRPNGDDFCSSAWVEYDHHFADIYGLNRIVGGTPHTFSLDSAKLACASDGLIDLWNITSEELWQIPVGDTRAIATIAFSPDGKIIVSMTRKGHISLWDVATGNLRWNSLNGGRNFYFQLDFDPPRQLHLAAAFSPDGEMLATVSTQRDVRIWSVATARCRHIFRDHFAQYDLGAAFDAVVFSPDSKLIASSSLNSSTIWVWDAIMGTFIQKTEVPGLSSCKLVFSQDGRYIETTRGSIRVRTPEAPAIWEQESRYPLLVTDQWISQNGKGIVWLSAHDKPTWVEVCGDVVVLGHGSGHVTWLYFNISP